MSSLSPDFTLKPLGENELEAAYQVFKRYMMPTIEAAFGWDENFQDSGGDWIMGFWWFRIFSWI